MDWTQATEQLKAPLNSAHVKEREGGGKKILSYIESWWAIAEANRIFGFNGWTSETVEIKCVAEKDRLIGKPEWNKKGWGVSYTAKVRVTVDGVAREGVGAGHGIDVDLGLAHESAIKEAESDARKRALMTFGNPFGLALYDKTQAMVTDEPIANGNGNGHSNGHSQTVATNWPKGNPDIKYYKKDNPVTPGALKAKENNAFYVTLQREIDEQKTRDGLREWKAMRELDIQERVGTEAMVHLSERYEEKMAALP